MLEKARASTPDSIYFVERLAAARATEALPLLEEKFARTQNIYDKAHIASALVRLGDRSDLYWQYLVARAEAAIDNDAPDFMIYDAEGKAHAGPSPEFASWAASHHLAQSEAGEEHVYWLPGVVGLLGITGDPRAVPLLRRALKSPNHMIQIAAAMSLAEMQEKDSVPLIIDACRQSPAEVASTIARALIYFDSPEAQSAADRFMPASMAKAFREARANGSTPMH
jgi:hypothetical protein